MSLPPVKTRERLSEVRYEIRGELARRARELEGQGRKLIKLKPDYVAAYFNRGNLYYGRREYDRAIADFDQAIKLKPDYASALNNRVAVSSCSASAMSASSPCSRTLSNWNTPMIWLIS